MKANNQKNAVYRNFCKPVTYVFIQKLHWANSSDQKVPSKLFLRKKKKITK